MKKHKDQKDHEGRDFLREKIRIRDKHKCRKCKRKWKEGQRRFDVHHKNEHLEGKNGNPYRMNKGKHMITYCHKCHLNLDSVRKKMIKGHKNR